MRAHLHLVVVCWAVAIATAFAGPAEARRVALVIGNADYKIGPLQNPVNDAAAVAEAFEKQLGFETVILKRNLAFNDFRAALDALSREAAGADIAVVYFAGHGMEVGGKNFLIPTDATLARPGALDLEAIPLETVLGQLDGVRELKLVILDACRNNPFVLRGSKRSVGRGFARIEPEDSTLVVYAAKDGTTADDGAAGKHSPFTGALLKHIATPDTEVRIVLGRIGDDVKSATGRLQEPHVYGTLGGKEFYLQPKRQPPPEAPAKTEPLPPSSQQLSEAERAWALVKDSASTAVIEAFRKQYGAANALYDRLAADRIEALKRAEEAKLALAMPRPPEPPVGKAPPPEPAVSQVPPLASVPVMPDLALQLQTELKRVGCDPGALDGIWGDKGQAALAQFSRFTKLTLESSAPTLAALDAVKGQRGRVCPLECGPNTVERDGACIAKAPPPAPPPIYRPAPKPKAVSAPPVPSKRVQRPKPESGAKSGMCWAVESRSNSLVPCSDPRAGAKAY